MAQLGYVSKARDTTQSFKHQKKGLWSSAQRLKPVLKHRQHNIIIIMINNWPFELKLSCQQFYRRLLHLWSMVKKLFGPQGDSSLQYCEGSPTLRSCGSHLFSSKCIMFVLVNNILVIIFYYFCPDSLQACREELNSTLSSSIIHLNL